MIRSTCLAFLVLLYAAFATHAQTEISGADLQERLDQLTARADAGDADAQFVLGMYYKYALPEQTGEQPDYPAAVRRFGEASAQGHAIAAYELGRMYDKAEGVKEDTSEAIRLYTIAAEADYLKAMVPLAEILQYEGLGSEAFHWARTAAEKGDPAGYLDMGSFHFYGIGTPRNFEKAMEAYRIAAEYGSCLARMNIAGLYYNGDGVKQSPTEAARWFEATRECAASEEREAEILAMAEKFLARIDAGKLPPLLIESRPKPKETLDGQALGIALIGLLVAGAMSGDGSGPASSGGGPDCHTTYNFSCDMGTDTVMAGAWAGLW